MILQILVFAFIVLLSLYLITQGWVGASMVFITALLSSILAAALCEPLQGIIGSWRPDYGRGVAFLLVFLIAFVGLRLITDAIMPKSIKLPPMVERVATGLTGFLAAMVIAGTTVIGIEMMPLPEALMPAGGMEGFSRQVGGVGGARQSLWLRPDALVSWIYRLACGRALGGIGGRYSFAEVHPDLLEELWGLRHRTYLASRFTLPPSSVRVLAAWSPNPADLGPSLALAKLRPDVKAWLDQESLGGKDSKLLVVRTEIARGTRQTPTTDDDRLFRATASQVRLLATRGTGYTDQYFPIGYMDHGSVTRPTNEFKPLGPHGSVIMDMPEVPAGSEGPANGIVIDWVYALPEDARPQFTELKMLARAPVPPSDSRTAPADEKLAWPPTRWRENPYQFTIKVMDENENQPIQDMPVYFLESQTKLRHIKALLSSAATTLEKNIGDYNELRGGWGPNSVRLGHFNTAHQIAINLNNLSNPDEPVDWARFLRVLMASAYTPVRAANADDVHNMLQSKALPCLRSAPQFRFMMTTNVDGKVEGQLGDGDYVAICWYRGKHHTYMWCVPLQARQKQKGNFHLTTKPRMDGSPMEIAPPL